MDKKLKSFKLLIVMLVCATLAACCGCAMDFSPSLSVKADTLINDYIKDPEAANEKYKNKRIEITGKVLAKGQFNNSQDFFVLIGYKEDGGKIYTVQLDYPMDKAGEVNKLHRGDFASAEGVCAGPVPQKNPNSVAIQIQLDGRRSAVDSAPDEKPAPAPAPEPRKVTPPPAPTVRTGIITGTDVRVRSGAGTNTDILGYFEKGERVTILEVQEGWYQVRRYSGQTGWVSAQFCRTE